MFFFSIASNQFETNLTFLGQIPSLIQLLVTIESPRTWQWAPRKNIRTVSENLFSLEQSSSWVTEKYKLLCFRVL